MKFISLFTRLGLLALGFILVAVVNDDSVWANASTSEPTTAGLADSLLTEWGFSLLVLGLLMAMAMVGAAFPGGLEFTIVAMTCEGERIAIEAESDGVAASGRPYHNQYHFLMEVRDGKIRRFKEYMDTMHAHEVMVESMAALAGEGAS